MKVGVVDGKRIYHAFSAGTQEVIEHRRDLNAINVFPVADADTGTNLALTLEHTLNAVRPEASPIGTLRAIADASLSGARGNSGVILAQFLNGLSAEMTPEPEVSAADFGASLVRSVPYAYGAVAQPVEGTMLTVIKAWSEGFQRLCKTTADFSEVFVRSLDHARASLRKTPEMLAVLKKASVVDAGAQGVVHFLEGVARLIQEGGFRRVLRRPDAAQLEQVPTLAESPDAANFRYCADGYLSGTDLPLQRIRQRLEKAGDSVIVAGSRERVRFHVHTDAPEEIYLDLARYGTFSQQKVDDMVRQQDVLRRRSATIALVTDSIADIPRDLLDHHQVHLVPLQLMVDGGTFLDRITVAPGQIFDVIDRAEEFPTSSQPPLPQVQELFAFLTEHYDSIIALPVSSQISGTFQSFRKAAEAYNNGHERVSVIDTRLNSGAQGLLVLAAAEAIAAGKRHQEVVQLVERLIPRTRIFVSVATFEYMVRGGRVSPLKGKVARWLNMKPIVSLDPQGKGVAFATAFSRRANTKKIMEIVAKLHRAHPIEKYCIVHADAGARATAYADELTAMLGRPPAYITEISPIVALSAGRGAVAVATMQGGG